MRGRKRATASSGFAKAGTVRRYKRRYTESHPMNAPGKICSTKSSRTTRPRSARQPSNANSAAKARICRGQAARLTSGPSQLILGHPHRFRVHKLANAEGSQLPPVARLLHAAKRNARIGSDHLVDEHHPSLQFVDEALALFFVIGPCARAQAKAHVVGNADCLILILHPEDGRYWPKEFFAIRRRLLWNVGQDRRLIIISLAFHRMPTGQ